MTMSAEEYARLEGIDPAAPQMVVGEIDGIRGFHLSRDADGWKLGSIIRHEKLPAVDFGRGVHVAECRRNGSADHVAPVKNCTCGFYAMWPRPGSDFAPQQRTLTGRIRAWGRVLPGQYGFRARFQQVAELFVHECSIDGPGTIGACRNVAETVTLFPTWARSFSRGKKASARQNAEVEAFLRSRAFQSGRWRDTEPISEVHLQWRCAEHALVEAPPSDYQRYWHRCCNRKVVTTLTDPLRRYPDGTEYAGRLMPNRVRLRRCAVHRPFTMNAEAFVAQVAALYDADVVPEPEEFRPHSRFGRRS